jgi:hypothetical protein
MTAQIGQASDKRLALSITQIHLRTAKPSGDGLGVVCGMEDLGTHLGHPTSYLGFEATGVARRHGRHTSAAGSGGLTPTVNPEAEAARYRVSLVGREVGTMEAGDVRVRPTPPDRPGDR